MSLPVVLPYGIVSIYGIGVPVSPVDIALAPGQLHGVIDQISQYGTMGYIPGMSVLFLNEDVQCRLAYSSGRYTLIQAARLVCQEIIPP